MAASRKPTSSCRASVLNEANPARDAVLSDEHLDRHGLAPLLSRDLQPQRRQRAVGQLEPHRHERRVRPARQRRWQARVRHARPIAALRPARPLRLASPSGLRAPRGRVRRPPTRRTSAAVSGGAAADAGAAAGAAGATSTRTGPRSAVPLPLARQPPSCERRAAGECHRRRCRQPPPRGRGPSAGGHHRRDWFGRRGLARNAATSAPSSSAGAATSRIDARNAASCSVTARSSDRCSRQLSQRCACASARRAARHPRAVHAPVHDDRAELGAVHEDHRGDGSPRAVADSLRCRSLAASSERARCSRERIVPTG